jgi:hypothetical protein
MISGGAKSGAVSSIANETCDINKVKLMASMIKRLTPTEQIKLFRILSSCQTEAEK